MKKVSQDNIKRNLLLVFADVFTAVAAMLVSDVFSFIFPMGRILLVLMAVSCTAVHALTMWLITKKYASVQLYYDEVSTSSFVFSVGAGELIRIITANLYPGNTWFTSSAFYFFCLFEPTLPEDIFSIDCTHNRALFIFFQLLFSLIHMGIMYMAFRHSLKSCRDGAKKDILAEEERENHICREKSYGKGSSAVGEFVREWLYESGLLFAAAIIVGTVSNVVILFIGYLCSLPYIVNTGSDGYTESGTVLIWLLLALFALGLCAFFNVLLAGEVGKSGAQFTYSRSKSLKTDMGLMSASIFGGIGVYTVLTMIVSLNAISYLFFASPVQYIARFIGRGDRSIWVDEAFDFEPWVIAAAVLIYAGVLVLCSAAGYIRGHKKYEKKIISDRQFKDVASSDSRLDSYTPPKESLPPVSRTSFTEKEMEALTRLNCRKVTLVWVKLILYFAAVVLVWYLWGKAQGNLFSPSAVAFTILLVLPFYPFRIHERLIGQSYYAEVVKCETPQRPDSVAARRIAEKPRNEIFLYLRLRNGTSAKLKLDPDGSAEAAYVPGETVYKLSAFKFPVKCTLYDDERFCPGCGNHFSKKQDVCPRCKLRITHKEKY